MSNKTVRICNKLGLHVRAATLLVQLAGSFDAEITISLGDQAADAKSIMEVLMLAATQGSDVVLAVQGESPAEEALILEALSQLINNRFNEAE